VIDPLVQLEPSGVLLSPRGARLVRRVLKNERKAIMARNGPPVAAPVIRELVPAATTSSSSSSPASTAPRRTAQLSGNGPVKCRQTLTTATRSGTVAVAPAGAGGRDTTR
jgi:hypothetical protein